VKVMLFSSFSLSSYVTFVVQINSDVNRQESGFIKQSVTGKEQTGPFIYVCSIVGQSPYEGGKGSCGKLLEELFLLGGRGGGESFGDRITGRQ
jgi:hypothetical protein